MLAFLLVAIWDFNKANLGYNKAIEGNYLRYLQLCKELNEGNAELSKGNKGIIVMRLPALGPLSLSMGLCTGLEGNAYF